MQHAQSSTDAHRARPGLVLSIASLGGLLAFLYPFVLPGMTQVTDVLEEGGRSKTIALPATPLMNSDDTSR
jgi:hypothetical protein